MKENLLHHIWQFKKFNLSELHSTTGEKIEIIHSGHHNSDAGPDFTMAKILVDGWEWIGNIEIHSKSSDWLKHKHDLTSSYKNVILHVVYEEDEKIPTLNEKNVPTLELKSYLTEKLLTNYNFMENKPFSFIPCEKLFTNYTQKPAFSFSEKLYIDKLQEKCNRIFRLLEMKNNDWESVLAATLAYTFGLKVNAEAFEQLFLFLDYKIIRKLSANPFQLEALFLGLTHSLKNEDEYSGLLEKEFSYLQSKYQLSCQNIELKYLRLRPANFPTIRLSQLADLLSQYQHLFSYVIGAKSIDQYLKILDEVKASSYWNTHYVLGKESHKSVEKKLSDSQKELIILNAFLPVKFAYSLSIGKSMEDEIITIISELAAEKNSIIDNFKKLGINFKSALDSQAFLNLYKNKCLNQQCLNCEIGYEILK